MPCKSGRLWTKKDYRDFDYIRAGFSLAQLAGLLAAQVVLQVSAFLYILLFIRRIKKLQEKYKGIDEETKNRFKTYRMAIEKLTKGEKLPQKEWKIIHENEDAYKAYWEEKKLKRKAALKVILYVCAGVRRY